MSAVPKRQPVLAAVPRPKLSVVEHLKEDTTQYPPAPFFTRLAATFIDQALLGVMIKASSVVLALMFTPENLLGVGLSLLISLAGPVAYVLYFMKKYDGQTPGKLLFKIRVISTVREDGNFTDTGGIIGRELFGKWLSAALLGLGYLLPVFRSDKKALHDLISRTRVIRYN